VLHVLLSNPGMRYEDLGADYYERRREVARQVSHHVGKLGALGYQVTLCRLPAGPLATSGLFGTMVRIDFRRRRDCMKPVSKKAVSMIPFSRWLATAPQRGPRRQGH